MAFDHPVDALPPGYRLKDYEVLRVLGRGGFGITYQARTPGASGDLFAIKELFPHGIAHRNRDYTVTAEHSGDHLENIVDMFIREKEVICGIHHPNIVGGREAFELNNTAYLVMRYVTGRNLRQSLRDRGGFHPDRRTMPPFVALLLDAIGTLHGHNILHCDIKTDNIFLGINFDPVLIDLGSARIHIPGRGAEIAQTWSANYSPIEMTHDHIGSLGPWSDIYQAAAVFYRCMAGGLPTGADERLHAASTGLEDPFMPLAEIPEVLSQFDPAMVSAVDRGLALFPKDRPQTVDAWRRMMPGLPQVDRRRHPIVNPGTPKPIDKPVSPTPRPVDAPAQAQTSAGEVIGWMIGIVVIITMISRCTG